jgi:hypothetical protein
LATRDGRENDDGIQAVHDYYADGRPVVKPALDEYFANRPEYHNRIPDKSGTAVLMKELPDTAQYFQHKGIGSFPVPALVPGGGNNGCYHLTNDRYQLLGEERMQIRAVMTTRIDSITPYHPLNRATVRTRDDGAGPLPVVGTEERLAGMVPRGDLCRTEDVAGSGAASRVIARPAPAVRDI